MSTPSAPSTQPKAIGFYEHLHLFRAITIILIVAAHSWSFPIFMYPDTWSLVPELKLLSSITETLFHDGTLLFAFISGLLFTLVLVQKGWQRFYINKVKNVFLPYVVISFVFTFIHWKVLSIGISGTPDSFASYLSTTLYNIAMGLSSIHLWYIPVLFILFALTPLLNLVVESKSKILILLLIAGPLFISRAWPYLSWTTVVYFAGAYLAGMVVGRHYHKAQTLIKRFVLPIGIIFTVCTLLLITLYQLDIEKVGFTLVRESVFYVQKLALIALLLWFCLKKENKTPVILNEVGDYSFAIYFVHIPIIIALGGQLKRMGLFSNNPWYVIVLGALILITTLVLSFGVTELLKKITGKKSRMLIGA